MSDVITYARTVSVERELLSPLEAAHALGMSRSRLYQLISEGEIASVKDGRSRRIPRSEVVRRIKTLTDNRKSR
jgi:excisionase family DNA binding protein